MNAGAVAGLAVGIYRAPVPHRLQRRDPGLDHVAARRAVERGDESDPAGIVLRCGIVETAAEPRHFAERRVPGIAHAAAFRAAAPSSAFVRI